MTSSIVTTEAFVLRSMKYRETSKIVTFYTRQFGRISGIVKGARQLKSKYGSALEPMRYVSLVLYRREGRELATVSQCDVLRLFPRLADDLEKMAVGLSIMELLSMIAHEEENIPLFKLVLNSMTALNDATKNPRNVFYYFEVHLARLFGFQPSFDKCVSCGSSSFSDGKRGKRIEYHLDKGGPLCDKCIVSSGHKVRLRPQSFRILERISANKNTGGIQNIEIDSSSKAEIESFLWAYLNYHVAGLHPLKSTKVFSRILSLS